MGIIFAVILRWMGRLWICDCGIGLYTFDAAGAETSQHLLDPYSLSHILHGVIFFWFLDAWAHRISWPTRLLLAIGIEMGWEVFENTPMVIDRYRSETAARGYTGDSILNSFGDVLSCAFGFWLTHKKGLGFGVALFLFIEFIMLVLYRDNLTLNVLMLLFPIDAIRVWQMG